MIIRRVYTNTDLVGVEIGGSVKKRDSGLCGDVRRAERCWGCYTASTKALLFIDPQTQIQPISVGFAMQEGVKGFRYRMRFPSEPGCLKACAISYVG